MRWSFFLRLLFLIAPAVVAAGERPLAIVHAVIIDGNGGAPIENAVIVLRGERIEAVGEVQRVDIPSDAKIVDARGAAVLPGLADMHVHLVGGWDGQTADFLGYQRYLDALRYAGVTTVLDTGNMQPFVLQREADKAPLRVFVDQWDRNGSIDLVRDGIAPSPICQQARCPPKPSI